MQGRRCSPITPLPAPNHLDGLPARKQWLEKRQRFLRTELEQLLRGYRDQHPCEPTFELEIICGVAKESAYLSSHCYHINFLAAASDGTRMLFFAQVWEEKRPDNTESCCRLGVRYSDRESEVSFCCPLPYYSPNDAYLGRCTICEFGVSKIVHPPIGLQLCISEQRILILERPLPQIRRKCPLVRTAS
ncbi:hypothetical protein VPH35_128968 [Triticum aestivum]|uniref:uncharacterized protein n=1 Tax=Triticum aestivum TaxID=4565 RepID=UPI001D020262|nr:uncharacterized protein LOC123160446 [Triticum aestivum]